MKITPQKLKGLFCSILVLMVLVSCGGPAKAVATYMKDVPRDITGVFVVQARADADLIMLDFTAVVDAQGAAITLTRQTDGETLMAGTLDDKVMAGDAGYAIALHDVKADDVFELSFTLEQATSANLTLSGDRKAVLIDISKV